MKLIKKTTTPQLKLEMK